MTFLGCTRQPVTPRRRLVLPPSIGGLHIVSQLSILPSLLRLLVDIGITGCICLHSDPAISPIEPHTHCHGPTGNFVPGGQVSSFGKHSSPTLTFFPFPRWRKQWLSVIGLEQYLDLSAPHKAVPPTDAHSDWKSSSQAACSSGNCAFGVRFDKHRVREVSAGGSCPLITTTLDTSVISIIRNIGGSSGSAQVLPCSVHTAHRSTAFITNFANLFGGVPRLFVPLRLVPAFARFDAPLADAMPHNVKEITMTNTVEKRMSTRLL